MDIEEIKAAVKSLSTQERRKVALYILELEKEHVSKTVGPQIAKDVDDVSRVIQEALDKVKKFVNKS
ncbi:MAG TPA: hypothetical protein VI758_06570 [Bacteroidota bacterium]